MTPQEILLRGVWKMIPSEDDTSWVRRYAEMPSTNEPLGDTGPLVRRMLDAGVSEKDIARFARIVGYETAFQILYHLEDPTASYEGFSPVDPQVTWQLFVIDGKTFEAREPLTGLHEMALMMDPSGREMRPSDVN